MQFIYQTRQHKQQNDSTDNFESNYNNLEFGVPSINYKRRVVDVICNDIIDALNIAYSARSITLQLLRKILLPKIVNRKDGYLEQYLSSQLDILANSVRFAFDVSDTVEVNHNYSTHAKFTDILKAAVPSVSDSYEVDKKDYAQLKALMSVTWDGNLISKASRDRLVKNGYVKKVGGWNFITKRGIQALIALKLIKAK